MNDQQLLRYSRHILLNEIGIEGQQRLLDARVLIIGLGGLGSPAALYLAASGVRQHRFRLRKVGISKRASSDARFLLGGTGCTGIAARQNCSYSELQI